MATSPAELTSKIVSILEKAEAQDRQRIISAAMVLLGDRVIEASGRGGTSGSPNARGATSGTQAKGAYEYFNSKDPRSKIEELAVAARFRETNTGAQVHSREDLETVFGEARRNFDSKNFIRDTINAKTKGFFNKGGERGQFRLAYYGQQFVDALPDHGAAKSVRKPKGARRKGLRKNKAK
jgi:hypothetical protein